MPLAIFDVDGTLTDTMAVDEACYDAAAREVLGVGLPSDWSELEEVTDPAILRVACERAGAPPPDARVESRVAERIAHLLRDAFADDPRSFSPIPGARDVFATLRSSGWHVAIATGAWRPSALAKLECARIPHLGVPLATASEAPARSGIVRLASTMSRCPDRRIVYVGDGVWDVRAAAAAGFAFVGVGTGARADALDAAGAFDVVDDLRNGVGFARILKRAVAPRTTPSPRIETSRFVMRCWEPELAPAFKAALDASLPELLPWIPWAQREPSDVAEIEARLAGYHEDFRAGRDALYGIVDPGEREVLGGAGLYRRVGPGALEIGYWVRTDHAGRGIATEASHLLTREGFGLADIERIEIRCDPENHASVAIARKLGYRHRETLVGAREGADGAGGDTMVWQMTADEYGRGALVPLGG